MLRDIYAPTDFDSNDQDPSLSPEEKLEIIDRFPVTVTPAVLSGRVYDDMCHVTLPLVRGITFATGLTSSPTGLFIEHVNVGDKELYGKCIGSRLLRATCHFAVERDPHIDRLSTGWARLGLVNTVVRVLGEENVAVTSGGQRYGWESDRALEEVFDDEPAQEGKRYLVYSIEAAIDPEQAMEWEKPVYLLPGAVALPRR